MTLPNKRLIPPAEPPYLYEYTDKYGDTLNAAPTGDGGVLLEITPKDGTTASVEIPVKDIPVELTVLLSRLISYTGRTQAELNRLALKNPELRKWAQK